MKTDKWHKPGSEKFVKHVKMEVFEILDSRANYLRLTASDLESVSLDSGEGRKLPFHRLGFHNLKIGSVTKYESNGLFFRADLKNGLLKYIKDNYLNWKPSVIHKDGKIQVEIIHKPIKN